MKKKSKIEKVDKQRNRVMQKYGSLNDEQVNNLCTFLNIKTDDAKVWIGAGVAVIIAIFYNHSDAVRYFIFKILLLVKYTNDIEVSNKGLYKFANQATIYTILIISFLFFSLVCVAYSHQKDLNWLKNEKEVRDKAKNEEDQLNKEMKKIKEDLEIKKKKKYLTRLRQRRRLRK